MTADLLISASGVRKKFGRSLRRTLWYGLKDMASEMLWSASAHDRLRPSEFWAVDTVSFELRRGHCLGLIGQNGAGKTTLLKLLNGLIKPDGGRIEMRGRVGALIGLGAGFNPILSGRENIYVNGSVLGLARAEIAAKIDSIIDFADIGDSIDAPLQSYSSGMQVRLGFAVATALDPDVLLLDEVLAVGDAAFRNKCYNRLASLRERCATIFVSHSMDQIEMVCDRVLVLDGGRGVYDGGVAEGTRVYEAINVRGDGGERQGFFTTAPPVTQAVFEFDRSELQHGESVTLNARVHCSQAVPNAVLRIVVYSEAQAPCAEWNSRRLGIPVHLKEGWSEITVPIGPLPLREGTYPIGINLNDRTGVRMLCWSHKVHALSVRGFARTGPPVALRSTPTIKALDVHTL